MKYRYTCRKKIGNGELFIKFINNWREAGFYADLLDALKDIHPQATLTTPEDRKFCDEYEYLVQTNCGCFELQMF